jgi:arsenite methyltransferase
MDDATIKKIVRESYAQIAKKSGCCPISCCREVENQEKDYKKLRYTEEELKSLPEGIFSLGCGNPVALASLKKGETVLDVGSGSGLDCFLASMRVGEEGRVIGIDMVPEMIDRAMENARKGNYSNVEFRLGEVENLPVADNSIDVVISNCVINLSPNKERVFEEIYRVLKPGGRLIISDIALLSELPLTIKKREDFYVSCISGAIEKGRYINIVEKVGFHSVKVINERIFPVEYREDDSATKKLRVASITIYGAKPQNIIN